MKMDMKWTVRNHEKRCLKVKTNDKMELAADQGAGLVHQIFSDKENLLVQGLFHRVLR